MRALGAFSTAAVTLMLLLASSAWAGTNVVPNPGFEQGGCGSTPIFCGWRASRGMTAETTNPHSGSASMWLQTCVGACNADDSWTSASASTDPAFCAAIGPGTHPASFWSAGGELTGLSATFYSQPDCTGAGGRDWLRQWSAGGELVGDLVAPPGTQSALFSLELGGHGVAYGVFDDLDVEDTVVADSVAPRLTARGYKQHGLLKVDLSWSGPSGASFDVYRDGARIATVHAPSYTDTIGRKETGVHTYKVCAPASAICSNEARVSVWGAAS